MPANNWPETHTELLWLTQSLLEVHAHTPKRHKDRRSSLERACLFGVKEIRDILAAGIAGQANCGIDCSFALRGRCLLTCGWVYAHAGITSGTAEDIVV